MRRVPSSSIHCKVVDATLALMVWSCSVLGSCPCMMSCPCHALVALALGFGIFSPICISDSLLDVNGTRMTSQETRLVGVTYRTVRSASHEQLTMKPVALITCFFLVLGTGKHRAVCAETGRLSSGPIQWTLPSLALLRNLPWVKALTHTRAEMPHPWRISLRTVQRLHNRSLLQVRLAPRTWQV